MYILGTFFLFASLQIVRFLVTVICHWHLKATANPNETDALFHDHNKQLLTGLTLMLPALTRVLPVQENSMFFYWPIWLDCLSFPGVSADGFCIRIFGDLVTLKNTVKHKQINRFSEKKKKNRNWSKPYFTHNYIFFCNCKDLK